MIARAQAAMRTPTSIAAAAAGVFAGAITLLVASIIVFSDGETPPANADVAADVAADDGATRPLAFEPGTCFNLGLGGSADGILTVDCSSGHQAEIVGSVGYDGSDVAFPGAGALNNWATAACQERFDDYVGDDLFATSLDGEAIYPTAGNWAEGARTANCYLTTMDGSLLTGSVAGQADEYPRSDRIVVARLLGGDCYRAESGTDPLALHTRNVVMLVDCDQPHHGVFFGRANLDFSSDAPFPDEETLSKATTDACTREFERQFGEDSDGFNYRYWWPSEASWGENDRRVLCTILNEELMERRFDPADYTALFDLDPAVCFNFGPEEAAESLGVDDKVLPIDCEQPHNGQMVASGQLDGEGEPFPGLDDVDEQAGAACSDAVTEFNRSITDEALKILKYWPPQSSEEWDAGDRRYVCAFAGDEPTSGSRQSADA